MCRSKKEGGLRCESHLASAANLNNFRFVSSVIKEAGINLDSHPVTTVGPSVNDRHGNLKQAVGELGRIDALETHETYSSCYHLMYRGTSTTDTSDVEALNSKYFETTPLGKEVENHTETLMRIKEESPESKSAIAPALKISRRLNQDVADYIKERNEIGRSIVYESMGRIRAEKALEREFGGRRKQVYSTIETHEGRYSETRAGQAILNAAKAERVKEATTKALGLPKPKEGRYGKLADQIIELDKKADALQAKFRAVGLGGKSHADIINGSKNGNLSRFKEGAQVQFRKDTLRSIAGEKATNPIIHEVHMAQIVGMGNAVKITQAVKVAQKNETESYKRWKREASDIARNQSFSKESMQTTLYNAWTAKHLSTSNGEPNRPEDHLNTLRKQIERRNAYMQDNINEAGGGKAPDSKADLIKRVKSNPKLEYMYDLLDKI